MEIKNFFELFKRKMAQFSEDDRELIVPEEGDEYSPGDITFLFNCVIFDIVKENQKEYPDWAIIVEPKSEAVGRGGYSDLMIGSREDDKLDYIEIEHENFPEKKEQLKWCIQKLAKSSAKHKILITYYYKNFSKERLIEQTQGYVDKFFSQNGTLHLFYSPWEGKFTYLYEQILPNK